MAHAEHRLVPLAALIALAAAGVVGAAAVKGGEEVARITRLKADTMHGAQLFEACTACHGTDAGGEPNGSVPRLAGQHAPVLIQQIIDFRGGRRWDLRMEQVVSRHQLEGPQAVADVAGYIAALAPALPAGPGAVQCEPWLAPCAAAGTPPGSPAGAASGSSTSRPTVASTPSARFNTSRA